MPEQMTKRGSVRNTTFALLVAASCFLSIASLGADHVIGVVGARYFFNGLGFGILLTASFYRFIVKDQPCPSK